MGRKLILIIVVGIAVAAISLWPFETAEKTDPADEDAKPMESVAVAEMEAPPDEADETDLVVDEIPEKQEDGAPESPCEPIANTDLEADVPQEGFEEEYQEVSVDEEYDQEAERENIRIEIEARYFEAFENIEVDAAAQIDGLIEEAKSEYFSMDEDDRDISAKLSLAQKYLKEGNELEEKVDDTFYTALESFRQELLDAGIDDSAADEAETEYKARKSERRKELLSKAMDNM